MMDKRLRKRSLRQFELESLVPEEPPRKKPNRLNTPTEHKKDRKERVLKPSPARKSRRGKVAESSSNSNSEGRSRQGKKLLVSLNIQDNDLQVSAFETGPKSTSRGKGKGRGRQGNQQQQQQQRCQSVGSDAGSSNGGSTDSGRSLNFKNPKFTFSSVGPNRKKVWKNLKQILTVEKTSGNNLNIVTYNSIDAPPSFKPAKKYSDISGLIANYTDPLTRLYFTTTEEFQIIRTLPQDIVHGHLALRGKMTIT